MRTLPLCLWLLGCIKPIETNTISNAAVEIEQSFISVQGLEDREEHQAGLEFLMDRAETSLGDGHELTLKIQNELAVYMLSTDEMRSLDLFENALDLCQSRLLRSEVCRSIAYNTAGTLASHHRFDEAQQISLELIKNQRELRLQHKGRITALEQAIYLAEIRADYELAEKLLRKILKIQRRQYGYRHPEVFDSQSRLAMIYIERGEFERGERLLNQVYDTQQEVLPSDHESILKTQHHLGHLYREIGQTERSEAHFQAVLKRRRRVLGNSHPDTIATVNNLAVLYRQMGRLSEAEELLEEALHAGTKQLGGDHPNTISLLNNTALLYAHEGRLEEAKQVFEHIYEQERNMFSDVHPDVLQTANNLAMVYRRLGDFDKASRLLEASIEQLTLKYGDTHSKKWGLESNLYGVWVEQRRYSEAEQKLLQVIQLQTKQFGAAHPNTLTTASSLSNLYLEQGRFDEASAWIEQTLKAAKESHSIFHPVHLMALQDHALLQVNQGRIEEAKVAFENILKIEVEHLGEGHIKTIQTMRQMAALYEREGLYTEAEKLLTDALRIQEATLGETHPEVLRSTLSLAGLFKSQGEYGKAEPLLLEVLHTSRGVFGSEHPVHLNSMMYLAELYRLQGRYSEAMSLFDHVVKVYSILYGVEHPYTLGALNGQAETIISLGDYAQVQPILEQIAQSSTLAFGREHPNTLNAMGAVGRNLQSMERLEEAVSILQEVLDIQEKQLGERHPDTLLSRANIASVYTELNRFDEALSLLDKTLESQTELFGSEHPSTIDTLRNMVKLLFAMENVREGIPAAKRLLESEEAFLAKNQVGSEESKRQFYSTFDQTTHLILTLVLDSELQTEAAKSLVLETLLRRQSKLLDIQTDLEAVYKRELGSEGEALLNQRKRLLIKEADLRNSLSVGDLEQNRRLLEAIQKEVRDIEFQLSIQSASFASNQRIPTLDDLQKVLDGTDLLMYQMVTPNPDSPETQIVLGLRLTSNGDVQIENLGLIDQLVDKVHALRQTRSKVLGDTLYQSLIEPMYEKGATPSKMFIVPDGVLTMLPFDLLRDSDGRYLIDETEIAYLSSGRDVMKISNGTLPKDNQTAVVAFADPNFGNSAWASLKQTSNEVDILRSLYPQVESFQGLEATLTNLRSVDGPTILHIATHGYLDSDDPMVESDNNPMVRSGLIFSDGQSGVESLRANEVVTLDLSSTELVVLSACESGLGQVSNGEGIYGLRRSLALAGAKAQVVSLWPVSDEGTQVFMRVFYGYLSAGKSKSDALRLAKMEMKTSVKWSAPVFWGAFVLVGF